MQTAATGGCPDAADRSRRIDQRRLREVPLPEVQDRMSHRIDHLVERGVAVVCIGVTGQVVAGVVRLAGRAAVDRGLSCGLDPFGAGEEAPRGDPLGDERAVVRPSTERCLRRREPPPELVVEDAFDLARALWPVG